MCVTNLREFVKTGLLINLCNFYLCVLVFYALQCMVREKYKFMQPVLDSHNSHQYSCSHVYINLMHKFVTLGYVKITVSCGKGSSYVQLMQ